MQPLEGKMAIPEAYIESFDTFLANKLGEGYMGDYYNYEDMYPDFTNFLTAKNKADTEEMESRFVSSFNVASSDLSPEVNKKFEVGDAYNTEFNSNAQPETIANLLNLQEGNKMRDLFEMINNQGENKSPLGNRANGILGNLLGVDSSRLAKIAQAANTMRYRPDQQLQASLQEEIEQAEGLKRANATAQYLEGISPELAGMVREGMLTASDALTYLSSTNKPSSWQLMSYQQWKKENPTGSMTEFLKLKTPSTNINMGGNKTFEIAQGIAEDFTVAQGRLAKLNELEILAKEISTGPVSGWITEAAPFLKDTLGLNLEGMDEAQQFNAIVSALQVEFAPKGQGTLSDAEREMIKKILPTLRNSPKALMAIIQTLKNAELRDLKEVEIKRNSFDPDTGEFNQQLYIQNINKFFDENKVDNNKIPTWNPETQQFE